jgi:hypothetical protein
MPASYLTTVGFGIVSALLMLLGSVVYPSLFPFLLPFAPFPVAFAAVRHHHLNGLGAALVAALFICAAASSHIAVGYFLFAGAPAWLLGYLFMLARPKLMTFKSGFAPASSSPLQWYSFGRIVILTAIMTALLTVLSVLMASGSVAEYQVTIKSVIEMYFRHELKLAPDAALVWPDGSSVQPAINMFAYMMPTLAGILWMSVQLFNLWLAATMTALINPHARPLPNFHQFSLPRWSGLLIIGGIILTSFSNEIHLFGSTLATAVIVCFALLGLCVVHAGTRGVKGRVFILLAVYFFLAVQGWPLLLLALLGGAEHMLSLRSRIAPVDK